MKRNKAGSNKRLLVMEPDQKIERVRFQNEDQNYIGNSKGKKGSRFLKRDTNVRVSEGKDPLQMSRLHKHFDFSDLIQRVSNAKALPKHVKIPKCSENVLKMLDLSPGKSYITRFDLEKMKCKNFVLPMLVAKSAFSYNDHYVEKGTMILYLGSVESEEVTGKNVAGGVQKIVVSRPIFLFGQSRFFLNDINALEPIS